MTDPKVYSTDVPGGGTVATRMMERRGVKLAWPHGSADALLAFVDSLSDDEVQKLRLVMLEPDMIPGVPCIVAHWNEPPPWKFRDKKGTIPPRIAEMYPTMLTLDGSPIDTIKRKPR